MPDPTLVLPIEPTPVHCLCERCHKPLTDFPSGRFQSSVGSYWAHLRCEDSFRVESDPVGPDRTLSDATVNTIRWLLVADIHRCDQAVARCSRLDLSPFFHLKCKEQATEALEELRQRYHDAFARLDGERNQLAEDIRLLATPERTA